MTHPRILMFLEARDKARNRGDAGIVRATTADLRRLGVPDNATESDPTGKHPDARRGPGRPPKPRCEHNMIADRCPDCNDEMVVKTNSRVA